MSPGSPAGHSDLREGDILIKIQGETIAGVEDFIRHIEEPAPGDKLNLTIRRGSEVRAIILELGTIDDAPMSFLRRRQAMRGDPFSVAPHDFPSMDFTDRALDDIRKQIRELRNEIREWRGAAPGDHSKPAGATPADAKEGEAAQRDSALRDHKPISEFPMRLPSGRAQNREPESKRGYPYGFYEPAPNWQFGSGKRFPDPIYGNSYYSRFGGLSSYYYYYCGNSNWNRYRPGASIQLGLKLGVYWY